MVETQLKTWIEDNLNGKVVSMERQARWRPCWFVDFESMDGRKPLYVRSRRAQAELLFYPLAHEAEILRQLHAAGIPSPKIYGMCPEPEAIVMDRMPGRPDLSTAGSKEEAAAALLDFMGILARMHAIPPEKFLNAPGLEMPRDPRALAFGQFDRFERIQLANKRHPQPEVTFVKKWVRRNPPMHRDRPAFITCDSGQFMFEKGRVTTVLDMELAHIGDPMLDIASLLLRDMSEPLGDLTPGMRRYEEVTGAPIDWDVVMYYVALWGIMTPMVTLHLSQDPTPELDHAYNEDQTFVLTRVPLQAIAEIMGIELEPMPQPFQKTGGNGSRALRGALAALRGALADLKPEGAFQQYRRNCASDMADYLSVLIEYENQVLDQDRAEVARVLGRDIAHEEERNAALERLVEDSGPERDAELVRLFYGRSARREALLGPKPKLFPRRAIQRPDKAMAGIST